MTFYSERSWCFEIEIHQITQVNRFTNKLYHLNNCWFCFVCQNHWMPASNDISLLIVDLSLLPTLRQEQFYDKFWNWKICNALSRLLWHRSSGTNTPLTQRDDITSGMFEGHNSSLCQIVSFNQTRLEQPRESVMLISCRKLIIKWQFLLSSQRFEATKGCFLKFCLVGTSFGIFMVILTSGLREALQERSLGEAWGNLRLCNYNWVMFAWHAAPSVIPFYWFFHHAVNHDYLSKMLQPLLLMKLLLIGCIFSFRGRWNKDSDIP